MFLHDKPADRRDLLTKLLGVGVYEKMGNLARVREAESAQKAALHREELERMADVSEESKKAAKARVSELARETFASGQNLLRETRRIQRHRNAFEKPLLFLELLGILPELLGAPAQRLELGLLRLDLLLHDLGHGAPAPKPPSRPRKRHFPNFPTLSARRAEARSSRPPRAAPFGSGM
jgi:hypothetical protein